MSAYATVPPVLDIPETEEQLLEISMGPQHPSTHGVFRMNVVLDGERVREAQAGLRLPAPPITKRLPRTKPTSARCPTPIVLDYLCSIHQQLGGRTPSRSKSSPASRFLSGPSISASSPANSPGCRTTLALLGFLLQDMGASGTPLMYAFRERLKRSSTYSKPSPARA